MSSSSSSSAPGVVRNSELSQAIADALHKPCFGWMPAIIARFAIGNYIQELAIDSKLVIPEKLLQTNFKFKHPNLSECLKHEIGHPAATNESPLP